MGTLGPIAVFLIVLGLILVGTGLFIFFLPHIPFLGRLPGDLTFRWGNTTVYFPIATSILVSVILSLLFSFFARR